MKVFKYLSSIVFYFSATLLSALIIATSIRLFVFQEDDNFTILMLNISCVLAIAILVIFLCSCVTGIVEDIRKIKEGEQ